MITKSNDYRKATKKGLVTIEGTAAGYREIVAYPNFVGATVPALASATYDIDVTTEEGVFPLAVALLITDTWAQIAAKIQVALRAATSKLETVTIVDGKIRVTSVNTGVTSFISLATGTTGSGGGDLVTAIEALAAYTSVAYGPIVTGTNGDLDVAGYQEITNTGALLTFNPATVGGLASATYDIDINIDGGGNDALAVPLLITDTWAAIAQKIETALRTATGSTERVEIINGKFRVTSATDGAASSVVIAAGTAGSGGGDILTAIDALGANYTPAIQTAVAGSEGQITIDVEVPSAPATDKWIMYQVRSSTGVEKTGFKGTYSKTTGLITLADNGASELAVGDSVYFQAVPYTE